jgi:hypothetical protein
VCVYVFVCVCVCVRVCTRVCVCARVSVERVKKDLEDGGEGEGVPAAGLQLVVVKILS